MSDSGKHSEHLSDEQIAQVVEAMQGNNYEQLPEPLKNHLADCLECKKEVMELYELMDDQSSKEGIVRPIEAPAEESGTPKWMVAAGVLIMFGLPALFFTQFWMNLKETQDLIVVVDTLHTPVDTVPEPALAETPVDSSANKKEAIETTRKIQTNPEYFAMHQPFEEQIHMDVRASTLTVLKPNVGEELPFGSPVELIWEQRGAESVEVIIYNNQGEMIQLTDTPENRLAFTPPEGRGPGLYYWKLLINGEVLFLGKFSIINK